MKKIIIILFFVQISILSFAQGHFVVAFSGNGQDHMNLNIVQATISSMALQAGDEIAAYDGSICCGKVILTQPISYTDINTFVTISVSKADLGSSNGYTVGNPISYRFWDASRHREIPGITTEYLDPLTTPPTNITAPTFSVNASAFMKLSVVAPPNEVPVANAGTDQSVNIGDNVTLDGSLSSDPDWDALTYSWVAPAGITLSSTSAQKPTFTSPQVSVNTDLTFTLVVNDGTVNSPIDQVVITVKNVPTYKLSSSVFLEGAYNSETILMNTSLNTSSLIPLSQPYNTTPWNYMGTELVASIPANVVDWVLVELRQAAVPEEALSGTIISGWPRACFLKSNGAIVDLDGTSPLNIGNPVITGNIYVVIRHRNHLGIMSATEAILNGDTYSFDFTTGVSQAYGGINGYRIVGSGDNTKAAMVAGDIDEDGKILVSDYNSWAVDFGVNNRYVNSDIDMDGKTLVSDYNRWAVNFGSTNGNTLKSVKILATYICKVPK